MHKFRAVIGILGILALVAGAILILSNFTLSRATMIKPGFLTAQKWQVGLISLGLIAFGLWVFGWLGKDIFLGQKRKDAQNKRPRTEAYRARKQASYSGIYLSLLLVTILSAILYYAFWG